MDLAVVVPAINRAAEALVAYRRAWHAVQEYPRMAAHQRISARVKAGLASAYAAQGERQRASELLSKALQLAEQSQSLEHSAAGASLPELFWCLAAACVRVSDFPQALQMLRRAIRVGWRDGAWLEADPELRPLSDEPEFLEMTIELRGRTRIVFAP